MGCEAIIIFKRFNGFWGYVVQPAKIDDDDLIGVRVPDVEGLRDEFGLLLFRKIRGK